MEGPWQHSHRRREIPGRVALISAVLFATAFANLFTKQLVMIAGISFSAVFFLILSVSQRMNAKQHAKGESELEQFRSMPRPS